LSYSHHIEDDSEQVTSVQNFTEVEKPSVQAAKSLGVSKMTANQAEAVVDAIDDLEDDSEQATSVKILTEVEPQSNNTTCTRHHWRVFCFDSLTCFDF